MTDDFRLERQFNGRIMQAKNLGDIGRDKEAKNAQAKLCDVHGHTWQNTTSPDAYICDMCGLVKLLVKSHWRSIANVGKRKSKNELEALIGLWEGILE